MSNYGISQTVIANAPAHTRLCPATTMEFVVHNDGTEVWECSDNGGCGYREYRTVGQ